MPKVMLLLPTNNYRAHDLLKAARDLGVDVVVGSERQQALEPQTHGTTLTVALEDSEAAVRQIQAYDQLSPLRAVIGLDDETIAVAARAAQRLGLRHNPPEAVERLSDKYRHRQLQREAGLPCPDFATVPLAGDPEALAAECAYPCVLKPTFMSASRGVIRADDPLEFVAAFRRIRRLLEDPEIKRRGGTEAAKLLVEQYVPGVEVALEGILSDGRLELLALFDKPDPLEGPFFEETIYVTPSRLAAPLQRSAEDATRHLARAAGLREGPVHAEIRMHEGVATVMELAPRAIGGHCSRVLRFGAGISLEALILEHAIGNDVHHLERQEGAAGVMMIPIPRAGTLHAVEGVARAEAVDGVEEVTVSIRPGQSVVPLPEGHRYLGFLFARGHTPAGVEATLRRAHACLHFEIR